MTPNAARCRSEIQRRWPNPFSVFNCRHIGSNPRRPWSQHAGSQKAPDGTVLIYRSNALDVMRLPGDTIAQPGTPHQLDAIYRWLVTNRERLGIRSILWRVSGHWDHIHVDFHPRMYDAPSYVPPCAGGTRLIVIYPDGTRDDKFVLWSYGDDPGQPEDGMIAKTSPREQIRDLQRMTNGFGYTDENGEPLVTDGVWGPRTQHVVDAMFDALEVNHPDEGWGEHVGDDRITEPALSAVAAMHAPPGPEGERGPRGKRGFKGTPGDPAPIPTGVTGTLTDATLIYPEETS